VHGYEDVFLAMTTKRDTVVSLGGTIFY